MKVLLRLLTALLSCVLGLLAMSAAPAWAQDHIVGVAFFEDVSGTLDFDAVRQQPFTPYAQPVLFKHTGLSVWLRLEISPQVRAEADALEQQRVMAAPEQLVLQINPPYVGEVTLYDPLDTGRQPRRASMSQPPGMAEFPVSNLAFVVPAGEVSRYVWLKFKTPRRMLVQVQALSLHEALQAENQHLKWRILSLSMLLLCLGLGLYLWWQERSVLMSLFVVRQSLVLLMILVADGSMHIPLPVAGPSFEDMISFGVMLAVAVNALFFQYFMRLFQVSRVGLRLLWLLLALFPVEMVLWVFGRLDLAQATNSFVILVTPLLIAGMVVFKAFSLKSVKGTPGAELIALPLIWSVPVIAAALSIQVIWALHFLGWVRQDWLPVGRETYISLLNGILIVLVLLECSKRSSQARNDVLLKLNIAIEQQALARSQHQESTNFLAMLTHELKTPLSTIRIALGAAELSSSSRARADRAVMDMSQVIDRCAQVELLQDDANCPPKNDGQMVDELLALVANCKEPDDVALVVPAGTPNCGVDAHMFGTILGNLLNNALKYRAPKTPVDIHLTRQDKDARQGIAVCVRNQPGSSGWPAPEGVFHKYYRSRGARRFTGSGLGLYLAERLAHRMGGVLTYEPDSTHVQFILWLPA